MIETYEDVSISADRMIRLRVYKGSGNPPIISSHGDTYDAATIKVTGFLISPGECVEDDARVAEVSAPEAFDRSDSTPLEINPDAQQLTFGEQLTQLRVANKLSQRQLAYITRIDHSTISRLETESRIPHIFIAATLVEVLKPDLRQTLRLIASLAKEDDKAYINGLFDLSSSTSKGWSYGLNTDVSKAFTPAEKAKDYKKRRGGKDGRSIRQIAKIGGIDHSMVLRFLSGEAANLSGTSFVSLARGLSLTRAQLVDFFYSFGVQRNGSVVTEPLRQKVS